MIGPSTRKLFTVLKVLIGLAYLLPLLWIAINVSEIWP